MSDIVDRQAVQRLVRDQHAQVVEVLPAAEYRWAHLPDAIHLPLKKLTAQTASVLDPTRPVIVYCHDSECDMSPRAVVRLRRLGFPRVARYLAGKMDWLSYGLPYEGDAQLAAELIQQDVPTCSVDDGLAAVRRTLPADGELCVVLDDDRIVQGVLGHETLYHGPDEITAGEAMAFGVSTVRPSEDVRALTERMRHAGVDTIIVTRSDGRLLGVFKGSAAETRLSQRGRQPAQAANGD